MPLVHWMSENEHSYNSITACSYLEPVSYKMAQLFEL